MPSLKTTIASIAKRSRFARDVARTGGIHGAMAQGTPVTRQAWKGARAVRWAPRYLRRRSAASALAANSRVAIDEARGYTIFSPGELNGVDAVVETARRIVERSTPEQLSRTHATDLVDASDLTADCPLLRFALDEQIVGAVAKYLGVAPVIAAIDVWHSSHQGEAPAGSRLWHLDGDDTRQVKVFVNVTDVTAANGPLTVLDGEASDRVCKGVRYRLGEPRVADDRVHEILGDVRPVPFEGPSGTVALVDTSRCFHFGSRVEPGAPPRVVVMIQYTTPLSFDLPGDHRQSAPYRGLDAARADETAGLLLGAR